MISKQWIYTMAFVGTTFLACSPKDSYKAAQTALNHRASLQINEVAEASVEEKALAVLQNDLRYSEDRLTVLSERMKTEYSGVSLLLNPENAQEWSVSILKAANSDCREQTVSMAVPQQVQVFQSVPSLGRGMCLESGCEHILLLLEARRNVKLQETDRGSIQSGVAAVLLKRDDLGIHKPVQTQSEAFLSVNDVSAAIQLCEESQRESVRTTEQMTARLRQVLHRLREIRLELNDMRATPRMTAEVESLTHEMMSLEDEKIELQRELSRQAAARRAEGAVQEAAEIELQRQRIIDAYREYARTRSEAPPVAEGAQSPTDEAVPLDPSLESSR